MTRCHACGQQNPEGVRFCSECGAELGAAVGAREQRKTVTVLFCDLTGSTALGESVDPEALRLLLARYFGRMKAIIEYHGGTVEKFIGDAVMAVFGVPAAHEDDALRAARAATEMRDALPEFGLQARIGLNTGEVVAGTEERLATGDAVNVAARLEQTARPGDVLLGESTFALVEEAVQVEPIKPLELKGKAAPVRAYRLLGLRDAPERGHETMFVGREPELRQLRQAWQRACEGRRCELITIVGDAGVGKSRLAAELLASIDAGVVRGRCLPYGEGITYWPVLEVLKQLDLRPADEAAAATITALLGETGASTSAEEIAWAFRKTLEEAAVARPLVVLFDDIQWGEQAFLDLIEHVALLSSGASILLLCLGRLDLIELHPVWPVTLRLDPLPENDVDALLPDHIGEDARERIARAAGGNPLFITEILAMADETKAEVVVPPTLHALLAARLDQLDAGERLVLERGAVEGEVFHRGAVQALAPDEPQVTPRLAALVRKQLIRPDRAQLAGEDGFRFRHLLIRDAAYEALPKAIRAELHARFATWLEEHGSALVELDELVAYHLEQAYRYRKELGYLDEQSRALADRVVARLEAAGRRALERGDMSAAVNMLERALELSRADDPRRGRLGVDLSLALQQVGEGTRAAASADAAIESAVASDDRTAEARARMRRAMLRMHSGQFGTAIAEAEREAGRALRVFEEKGDASGTALALDLMRYVRFRQMRVAESDEIAERALQSAERAGDESLRRTLLGGLAASALWGPLPVEDGIRRCESVYERVRGDRRTEANCLMRLGGLHALAGRFDVGRRRIAEARSIMDDLGLLYLKAHSSDVAFFLELLAGDAEAARLECLSAYEALAPSGERFYLAGMAEGVARAAYELGRYEESDRWLLIAEDAEADEPESRALRAKLVARRGRLDEAVDAVREAAAGVEYGDLLFHQGNMWLDAAEVLELAGRHTDARTFGQRAIDAYERKGATAAVSRAGALLNRWRGRAKRPHPGP